MPTRVADLRFVNHPKFGVGCVFAERLTDSGSVLDVWFVADQKLRIILSEHVTDTDKPKLPMELRKALRSAHSTYRLSHKRHTRLAVDKPRVQREFRDRVFKAEWTRIDVGDDPTPTEEIPAVE